MWICCLTDINTLWTWRYLQIFVLTHWRKYCQTIEESFARKIWPFGHIRGQNAGIFFFLIFYNHSSVTLHSSWIAHPFHNKSASFLGLESRKQLLLAGEEEESRRRHLAVAGVLSQLDDVSHEKENKKGTKSFLFSVDNIFFLIGQSLIKHCGAQQSPLAPTGSLKL